MVKANACNQQGKPYVEVPATPLSFASPFMLTPLTFPGFARAGVLPSRTSAPFVPVGSGDRFATSYGLWSIASVSFLASAACPPVAFAAVAFAAASRFSLDLDLLDIRLLTGRLPSGDASGVVTGAPGV